MTGARFFSHRARGRTVRGAAAGLLTAGAFTLAPAASAQDRWAVDTSASAGVSTNPYLRQGSGSSGTALQGTLDVRPSLVIERPLTRFELSADGQITFYNHDYPTNESFTLSGFGTHQLSQHTTVHSSVSYLNTITGSVYNSALVPLPVLVGGTGTAPTTGTTGLDTTAPVVTVPTASLPLYLNDPALGVLGRRQQAFQFGGGIATTISARDSISADSSVSFSRFDGIGLGDFNYFTPSVSWQRALSDRTSLGATFVVGFTDYLRTNVGDATTYAPQATLSHVLGSGWRLNASLGVTFANLHEATGGTRSTSSLSGSASVCQQDARRNMCFSASRQVAPSALQGLRTDTSVSASLTYLLNEYDSLSGGVSYSHADEPLQRSVVGLRSGSIDYVNATGSYSHRFARALSGFVNAGYAKTFDDRITRGGSFTGQVGISYRFGSQR